jgi:hypothetical protein
MYEPTDAEQGMMGQAREGDLISLMGLILKVTEIRPDGFGIRSVTCEWTHQCAEDATQLVPHLLLTYVPACERCATPIVSRYPRILP